MNGDEIGARGSLERRWAGYVIGLLLTVTGFLLSTALTFGLFWLNSLSARVGALEAKGQVVERAVDDVRLDVKEIKVDLKRNTK